MQAQQRTLVPNPFTEPTREGKSRHKEVKNAGLQTGETRFTKGRHASLRPRDFLDKEFRARVVIEQRIMEGAGIPRSRFAALKQRRIMGVEMLRF